MLRMYNLMMSSDEKKEHQDKQRFQAYMDDRNARIYVSQDRKFTVSHALIAAAERCVFAAVSKDSMCPDVETLTPVGTLYQVAGEDGLEVWMDENSDWYGDEQPEWKAYLAFEEKHIVPVFGSTDQFLKNLGRRGSFLYDLSKCEHRDRGLDELLTAADAAGEDDRQLVALLRATGFPLSRAGTQYTHVRFTPPA